jgi:hypothetical protein
MSKLKFLSKEIIPDAISILQGMEAIYPLAFYEAKSLKKVIEDIFEATVSLDDIVDYIIPYDPEVEDRLLTLKHVA